MGTAVATSVVDTHIPFVADNGTVIESWIGTTLHVGSTDLILHFGDDLLVGLTFV